MIFLFNYFNQSFPIPSNGDLNLYARLDANGRDLFNDLCWAVEVDEALVDSHLEAVPRLGTLSAGSLPRCDAQGLGGHTDWSFYLQVFAFSALDQGGTH